jgi:hypothetical protein
MGFDGFVVWRCVGQGEIEGEPNTVNSSIPILALVEIFRESTDPMPSQNADDGFPGWAVALIVVSVVGLLVLGVYMLRKQVRLCRRPGGPSAL